MRPVIVGKLSLEAETTLKRPVRNMPVSGCFLRRYSDGIKSSARKQVSGFDSEDLHAGRILIDIY
jgi:hypothetical protein